MLRDVFYYNNKPNAHPRERHANSIDHARQLATTEHFWIIDEFSDYRGFDWGFDFEFLPDEDVWAEAHNNVWPSPYHRDSGTRLCPKEFSELVVYRSDVDPIPRKNILSDNWKVLDTIATGAFDFNWHPDPSDPPYIYAWGNKWYPVEKQSVIEYHTPGATSYKFMNDVVELAPLDSGWTEYAAVDNEKFDFTWRPEPGPVPVPYVYTWGDKWVPGTVAPALTYTVPGATAIKHMGTVDLLEDMTLWKVWQPVESFDFSWHPDPTSPPYIYVWGNKWIDAKLQPTLTYHTPGGVDFKYMTELVDVRPQIDRWQVLQPIDTATFDLSWRPDPREPPYIYVWGNKWIAGEVVPTLTYTCPGATEHKYMTELVDVLPESDRWKEHQPIDFTSFDLSWRPDPREPPYIYIWGNKWIPGEVEFTLTYTCPGATEHKYMTELVDVLPQPDRWKEHQLVDHRTFDFTWRPNPTAPAYIYVWGNKWVAAEVAPTLTYKCPGAIEYKYMTEIVGLLANSTNWDCEFSDYPNFDFTWKPNPFSPPQVYQWINGPRYTVPGATDVIYMDNMAEVTVAIQQSRIVGKYTIKTTLDALVREHPTEVFWALNPDLVYDKFDFNWRPEQNKERFINVFGNKYSNDTQTYFVNAPAYLIGYQDHNYIELVEDTIKTNMSMFWVDRGNPESAARFEQLKQSMPRLQKTRFLNSWVDTINRCVNKSETGLFWVLNSELDYTDFNFDYYPGAWQAKMMHVFGTQWSHWGNTYLVNRETFADETKYVKIVEHLNILNFVKDRRATSTNCLYDVCLIDHGNDTSRVVTQIKSKISDRSIVTTVEYNNSYMQTLTDMLDMLPLKKDHYMWVCSSVCDYSTFDFTYVCDPFAKEQLHVFPSDRQKFGDTFLLDVNKLRENIDTVKINYNITMKAKRLSPPIITVDSDTHCYALTDDFAFPYAVFETEEVNMTDHEPMNLWSAETKSIIVTSTGASRIIVPKEAVSIVKKELYDYPYITKSANLTKSSPLDVVFLSNGEIGADENFEHLQNTLRGMANRVVRVDGVNGRVAAYHAAASASETPWMITVFAKLKVSTRFDWNWQPDRLQIPKHYIFHATNPVNGLTYGHQAAIAYNKKLVLANAGTGLDFTLDSEHEVVEMISGVANYNTDAYSTWRTAFREAIKLRADTSAISKERLTVWTNDGIGEFAQYSIDGARHAVEYFESVNGEMSQLRLSYDWAWLREYYHNKYPKALAD